MSGEAVNWKFRVVLRILHGYFLVSRGMTLGVRAACFDESGRLFLVRHSYVPGWYMPGGGVERDETAGEALTREMQEEGNLVAIGEPQLFGFYFNRAVSKRDHLLFYRVTVAQTAPKLRDREIVESGFFALDNLPQGTTPATLRRIAELRDGAVPSAYW